MAEDGAHGSESLIEVALEAIASVVVDAEGDAFSVLKAICEHARRITYADSAFVAVPSGFDAGFMEIVAWSGNIPPRALDIRIPVESTESGRALTAGRVGVVADFSNASPASSVLAQIFEVESGVFAPIKPIGTLAALSRQVGHFGDTSARYMQWLAAMTSAAIRIAEGNRARVREALLSSLHDGAMQLHYAALLKAEMLKSVSSVDEARALGDEIATLVRDGLAEMRKEITGDVSAEESLGDRLRTMARMIGQDVDVSIVMEGGDLPGSHPWARQLGRIAMEAMSNAIRHGKASQIVVEFKRSRESTVLSVTDNGTGFDIGETSKGMGLINMPRRAEAIGADFSIDSAPGSGTRVVVEVHRDG